jgi:hypothetical protein
MDIKWSTEILGYWLGGLGEEFNGAFGFRRYKKSMCTQTYQKRHEIEFTRT